MLDVRVTVTRTALLRVRWWNCWATQSMAKPPSTNRSMWNVAYVRSETDWSNQRDFEVETPMVKSTNLTTYFEICNISHHVKIIFPIILKIRERYCSEPCVVIVCIEHWRHIEFCVDYTRNIFTHGKCECKSLYVHWTHKFVEWLLVRDVVVSKWSSWLSTLAILEGRTQDANEKYLETVDRSSVQRG